MQHATPISTRQLTIDQLALGRLIAAEGLLAHLDAAVEVAGRFLDQPRHRASARIVLDAASSEIARERAFGRLPLTVEVVSEPSPSSARDALADAA